MWCQGVLHKFPYVMRGTVFQVNNWVCQEKMPLRCINVVKMAFDENMPIIVCHGAPAFSPAAVTPVPPHSCQITSTLLRPWKCYSKFHHNSGTLHWTCLLLFSVPRFLLTHQFGWSRSSFTLSCIDLNKRQIKMWGFIKSIMGLIMFNSSQIPPL